MRKNDASSVLPGLNQFGNQLRRVLQIAVEQDHRVGVDLMQPGADGGLMAEVARKFDDLKPRIAGSPFEKQRDGLIRAAVVDERDFPTLAGFIAGIDQAAMQFRDILGLIEKRNHDFDHGTFLFDCARSLGKPGSLGNRARFEKGGRPYPVPVSAVS